MALTQKVLQQRLARRARSGRTVDGDADPKHPIMAGPPVDPTPAIADLHPPLAPVVWAAVRGPGVTGEAGPVRGVFRDEGWGG
ncbi:hypothetical protein Lfu02_72880 [Longispora fulva]|nr:hypothetical protein Lfu02_72880 [Longispora fulva]